MISRIPFVLPALALALASSCAAGQGPSEPAPAGARSGQSAHGACEHARPTTCTDPAPGYTTEVEPLLAKRCLGCHSGDGAAAEEHDFSHFETLHAQARQVLDVVAACAMPPKTAPPLESTEADTLLRWVACGAER